MKKELLVLFITAMCSLLFFTILILIKGNYEFLSYLVVVLALMILVYTAQRKVQFPQYVLWHLLIWADLHLAGGTISIAGTRLYDLILIPLIAEPYNILKFDQFVHIYGFFAATLAAYYILKPLIKKDYHDWPALFFIVVMAGLGLGALNEIVEFTVTIIVPKTGVGGYINNALDLVADLLGAIIAFVYVHNKEQHP